MQEWWKWPSFYRNENIRTWILTQKLIAGIVLTGGGAIKTHQAVSRIYYWNGYKNRINEHLAGNSDEEISSPLCNSSWIGDEKHWK
jgi:hypothetical protein